MNENEFKDTLIEVRKAYRLIYLYQRRVLDLIDFISSKLSVKLHSGWSKFSNNAPTRTRVNLNRWAWDWITLYLYEFHFGEIKNDIHFSILLQSDSGYFESNAKDRLDISNFLKTEDSSTKLFFVAARGVWGCPIENLLKDKFNSQETEFEKITESNEIWIAKSYDLSRFINEESTIALINDFITYSRRKGIEIIDKKDEIKQSV